MFCIGHVLQQDPRDEVFDEEGVSNDMLDFLNELFQGVSTHSHPAERSLSDPVRLASTAPPATQRTRSCRAGTCTSPGSHTQARLTVIVHH